MRWVTWASVTFAMHFVWEMSQAKWFASMAALPFWTATYLCFRAAVGDLVITAIAFALAAAAARRVSWPLQRGVVPIAVFLAIGLIITIAFEVFALRTGRWTYAVEMPTLFGIGVLPLLQWSVIPPLEVVFFRVIWRSEAERR